jgi:hypothetical protein
VRPLAPDAELLLLKQVLTEIPGAVGYDPGRLLVIFRVWRLRCAERMRQERGPHRPAEPGR